jgi:D-lyxose ketol-isomerase
MKTNCPTCKKTHEITKDMLEMAHGRECETCLDKSHVRFVIRNAKRSIYPYGREYAEKLMAAM